MPAEPAGAARIWLDRGLSWRDRWLANPRFQRWAAGFWPTRPIAQRRTRALFDLCAGFVYSQVLFACVRLRLFDILAEGPQPFPDLVRRLKLPPDGTDRLLRAAVSLRLVERRGRNRFGLGVLGAALAGNPAVAAMIAHHDMLYADLRDPLALLCGETGPTELAQYWSYAGAKQPAALPPERVAAYTELMAASQPLVAAEVLDAYSLQRHHCLLDVGGGEGAFLAAAAARAPELRVILFDLPSVAERARSRFAADGLTGRAIAVGGDFLSDPLPKGADVISLIRVVHDHDDDAPLSLLRAARMALSPGGALLLAEPMAETPGAEPVGDAYFGFYLLAMGRGRPRTAGDLARLLHTAGFCHVAWRRTRTPLLTSLIVART